ncbi:MAG: hypothetical protein LBR86_03565 [Tannerella sp.]|jgi:hypothetical protein|nr:hypothetical protein [Tannerella sp.]
MRKNKRTSPLGAIFFLMQYILVMAIATTLEMALLEEWIIAVPRGTFQGTATVIIGSIIVFAISWGVSCFLSANYLKRFYRNKEQLEGENSSLPKKTGMFYIEMRQEHSLSLSFGLGIITVILLQLFTNDYFISIPHGTHKGGMTAAIGSLIICATVFILALSVTLLVNYFRKKNGHKGSI